MFEIRPLPVLKIGTQVQWMVILGLHVYSSMGDMYIAVSPHWTCIRPGLTFKKMRYYPTRSRALDWSMWRVKNRRISYRPRLDLLVFINTPLSVKAVVTYKFTYYWDIYIIVYNPKSGVISEHMYVYIKTDNDNIHQFMFMMLTSTRKSALTSEHAQLSCDACLLKLANSVTVFCLLRHVSCEEGNIALQRGTFIIIWLGNIHLGWNMWFYVMTKCYARIILKYNNIHYV